MSANMTYEEEQLNFRRIWLTEGDEKRIQDRVRKAAFSWNTPAEVLWKTKTETDQVVREIDRIKYELSYWLSKILEIATDEVICVPSKRDPLSSYRERVEMYLADQVDEETEEWKVDREAHEMARKVLALTPYQIFTFRQVVVEAAADAARDQADSILDGENVGRELIESVSRAASKWIEAWKKEA